MYGDIETAKNTIIVAWAVLHNIAIDKQEDKFSREVNNEESSSEILPAQITTQNTVRGNIWGRQFIETHFE